MTGLGGGGKSNVGEPEDKEKDKDDGEGGGVEPGGKSGRSCKGVFGTGDFGGSNDGRRLGSGSSSRSLAERLACLVFDPLGLFESSSASLLPSLASLFLGIGNSSSMRSVKGVLGSHKSSSLFVSPSLVKVGTRRTTGERRWGGRPTGNVGGARAAGAPQGLDLGARMGIAGARVAGPRAQVSAGPDPAADVFAGDSKRARTDVGAGDNSGGAAKAGRLDKDVAGRALARVALGVDMRVSAKAELGTGAGALAAGCSAEVVALVVAQVVSASEARSADGVAGPVWVGALLHPLCVVPNTRTGLGGAAGRALVRGRNLGQVLCRELDVIDEADVRVEAGGHLCPGGTLELCQVELPRLEGGRVVAGRRADVGAPLGLEIQSAGERAGRAGPRVAPVGLTLVMVAGGGDSAGLGAERGSEDGRPAGVLCHGGPACTGDARDLWAGVARAVVAGRSALVLPAGKSAVAELVAGLAGLCAGAAPCAAGVAPAGPQVSTA